MTSNSWQPMASDPIESAPIDSMPNSSKPPDWLERSQRLGQLLGQQAATVWLTGLSGAGKSTLAFALETRLLDQGRLAYVLDGDQLRQGLCRDIGFSPEFRHENIRRVAEVAKLFNQAGLLVIAAFISPYQQDRAMARDIIGSERFIEVHMNADLGLCESRDVKGLYQQARAGTLSHFTGISAPYEAPAQPDLTINSGQLSIAASVDCLMAVLAPYLRQGYPRASAESLPKSPGE